MLTFSVPQKSRAKLGQQTYYAPYPFVGPAAGPVIAAYPSPLFYDSYPGSYYPGPFESVQVNQAPPPVAAPAPAPAVGIGIKDLLLPAAILGGIVILATVL